MTYQGGKKAREENVAPSSTFACLQPLLEGHEQDIPESLQRLAQALGSYDSPVRLQIRVIGEDQTVNSWDVKDGSASSAARRSKAKAGDVVVVVRHETWLQIAQGRLAPFDALFEGKLRVGGDLELAKSITQHLSDPAVPFVSPC
jgi:hypothetical protein